MIRRFNPILLWLVLIAVPSEASAQYFGRNKVEYHDFDFRVLESAHFDVYYYPREEQAARLAARESKAGVVLEARPVHGDDPVPPAQEVRDALGVGLVLAHADRERLRAAQREPRIPGPGHAARRVLREAEPRVELSSCRSGASGGPTCR